MRRAFIAVLMLSVFLLTLPTAGATRTGTKRMPRGKTIVVQAAEVAAPLVWTWAPPEVTIRAGDRVRWKNPTDVAHSVRPWEEGAPSPPPWGSEQTIEPGGSVIFRFTEPGVYAYRCGIGFHSDVVFLNDGGRCVGMCGVITVE